MAAIAAYYASTVRKQKAQPPSGADHRHDAAFIARNLQSKQLCKLLVTSLTHTRTYPQPCYHHVLLLRQQDRRLRQLPAGADESRVHAAPHQHDAQVQTTPTNDFCSKPSHTNTTHQSRCTPPAAPQTTSQQRSKSQDRTKPDHPRQLTQRQLNCTAQQSITQVGRSQAQAKDSFAAQRTHRSVCNISRCNKLQQAHYGTHVHMHTAQDSTAGVHPGQCLCWSAEAQAKCRNLNQLPTKCWQHQHNANRQAHV